MEVKEVGKGFPFKEMNPMEPFSGGMTPAFNEYYDLGMKGRKSFILTNVWLIKATGRITEADILRDLLYVFQGIDGRFLKYEARPDAFVLDASVKLPRPTMELVNKLAELGWLYFTIQKNLGTLVAQSTTNTGLVGQSLHSAFKDELVDFYRLIAMLENELFSIKNRPDTFTAIGLSLKRLFVWVLEPLERLRLIHLLMDATKEAKGGAIISTLSKYAEHGDPYIKTFISKLLPKVR